MKKDMRTMEKVVHHLVDGKWAKGTSFIDVEVMAISGKWAMVRRKGCAPIICETKKLNPSSISSSAG